MLRNLLLEDTHIGIYMCNHVYMFMCVHTFFVYGYAFTGVKMVSLRAAVLKIDIFVMKIDILATLQISSSGAVILSPLSLLGVQPFGCHEAVCQKEQLAKQKDQDWKPGCTKLIPAPWEVSQVSKQCVGSGEFLPSLMWIDGID